jgi:hypothetical protein
MRSGPVLAGVTPLACWGTVKEDVTQVGAGPSDKLFGIGGLGNVDVRIRPISTDGSSACQAPTGAGVPLASS